jgi:hypothetical protein
MKRAKPRASGCGRTIDKGQLRLVLTLSVTPRRTTRKSRCLECLDNRLAAAVVGACGVTANLPVASNVDPDTAASLKRRLATLSCQPVSRIATRDEGCACSVTGHGAWWGGRDDERYDEGTEACHNGAKALGK